MKQKRRKRRLRGWLDESPMRRCRPFRENAVRLAYEVRENHITLFVTIGRETLGKSDVTALRLIDTGGDVCYMRELDLKRRDGAGTIYRTDIVVRVEEKEHV